jgi:hypothetical protein
MEYVSVLAGVPFTDHPKCTHPALAALARLVNDSIVDEEIRRGLARLAPDLIGVTGDPRMTHCVIANCLVAATVVQPASPRAVQRRLARTCARMRHRERQNWWARTRLHCWEVLNPPNATVNSAFQFAVERMRGLAQREKDARLSELLHSAVAECRMLNSWPAQTADRTGARVT